MSDPELLTTKLCARPLPPQTVTRRCLVAKLNAGIGCRLVLVSAPAGYGKSTLLSQWTHQTDRLVAWLSLDPDDNELTSFLRYLIAALDTLKPNPAQTITALLQSPQPPVRTVMAGLVNELSEVQEPAVLVLDDYHVIQEPSIHEATTFLLNHLPSQVQLAILTRADPPLPLARLRARRQLLEIRASDLRFTTTEAQMFINELAGLNVSTADVVALTERTEGWITGLQLAALSMQGQDADQRSHFVAAFAGSHRYIVDYLVEEVLSHQPAAVRDFLLQTSVLERLTAALCDAVTGQADGRAMLERLEQRNLFVIPLDDERQWYRYHHLFAEVLWKRLRQHHPDWLPTLHGRATAWFEQNGFLTEAVQHALAADDKPRAARLIEENALGLLMYGRMRSLLNWIEAVGDLALKHPWLRIHKGWALILLGRLEEVESVLASVERSLPSQRTKEEDEMVGHVAAIRAYKFAMQGEAARAVTLAGEASRFLPERDAAVRSVVTFTLGTAHRLKGNLTEASQTLEEAWTAGSAADNLYLALGAISSLADLKFDQGQLHHAARTYREMLALATWPDGRRLPAAAMALFGLGMIDYEWNELQPAEEHTLQARELACQWGHLATLAGSQIMLYRIWQAQGRPDSAQEALHEAQRLARDHVLAPRVTAWLEAFRVRSWLSQAKLDIARNWVESSGFTADDNSSYLHDAVYQALVRVYLATQETDQALPIIERLRETAESAGRMGSLVETLALEALVQRAAGNIPQALVALETALFLAQPEGFVRIFVDEGPPMRELLRHAASRGIEPQYVAFLLEAFPLASDNTPAPEQPLIDPLSERELEVLSLISAGLSNQAVADELVISLGTVKAHTASIYRKLNVNSRTQATARARELRLLQG